MAALLPHYSLRLRALLRSSSSIHIAILVDDLLINRLLKLIDFRLVELPRADLPLEQHIHLREGSSCWFWEVKVCVNDTAEADTSL